MANVELLIKFDLDDESLELLQDTVSQFTNKMSIRYIVTSRAGGYGDLHKAYLDLLRLANADTTMYWVISDDITLDSQGWDSELLSCSKKYTDGIFVIHTSHLLDHLTITPRESIESPDAYPVWSAKWIGLQGGFGYTFATDGWTSMVCHRLMNEYHFDRRIMANIRIARNPCAADMPGSERWHGIRKQTHDFIVSPQLQKLADCTAQNMVRVTLHYNNPNRLPARIWRTLRSWFERKIKTTRI